MFIFLTLFCKIDLVISGSILQEVNNSKKDANFKRSASQREIFLTQFAFYKLWWTICAKYTSKENVSKPYFLNYLNKNQGGHSKKWILHLVLEFKIHHNRCISNHFRIQTSLLPTKYFKMKYLQGIYLDIAVFLYKSCKIKEMN